MDGSFLLHADVSHSERSTAGLELSDSRAGPAPCSEAGSPSEGRSSVGAVALAVCRSVWAPLALLGASHSGAEVFRRDAQGSHLETGQREASLFWALLFRPWVMLAGFYAFLYFWSTFENRICCAWSTKVMTRPI